MSTLTVVASSANESANRTSPNSSARGAATRPDGNGAGRGALAHQPVDVGVHHVVERARAAAGEREPEHHREEVPAVRPAAGADEHPGRAGEEQQRHDPRLRQRDVVAPGAERDAARRGTRGRARRARRRARLRRRRRGAPTDPAGVVGERDEAAGRDREQHQRRARRRSRREARVGETRDDDGGHEQRQRDERRRPVAAAELERRADDDDAVAAAPPARASRTNGPGRRLLASERIELLQLRAQVVERPRARHVGGPSRSCAAAAARSCTTRACRPATGRCPPAVRSSARATASRKKRTPTALANAPIVEIML